MAANKQLMLGDTAPDFSAETSQGPIKFYDWLGPSWGCVSHCLRVAQCLFTFFFLFVGLN